MILSLVKWQKFPNIFNNTIIKCCWHTNRSWQTKTVRHSQTNTNLSSINFDKRNLILVIWVQLALFLHVMLTKTHHVGIHVLYIHMYIYAHIYTYTYIYMYMCVCVFVWLSIGLSIPHFSLYFPWQSDECFAVN
jgi:hypothetical protein